MEQDIQLAKFSVEQLQTELKAREQKRREDVNDFIVANIDFFLLMVPEHGRAKCSDTDPNNESRGCVRCRLLEIKRDGGIYATIEHFTLEIGKY